MEIYIIHTNALKTDETMATAQLCSATTIIAKTNTKMDVPMPISENKLFFPSNLPILLNNGNSKKKHKNITCKTTNMNNTHPIQNP